MPFYTYNATSNTTPDPGQGGLAVTGASNTGHSSTTASCVDGATQRKSCKWTAFPSTGGQPISVTLKFDHTSSGSLVGAGATNAFGVDYSLNGGTNWTAAVFRENYTASQGPTTASVALPVSQDLTQVQVRDLLDTSTLTLGESASATATISNIKIEVLVGDSSVIAMM